MKPTELRSYFQVIRQKKKTGLPLDYEFYVNSYAYRILKALQAMDLITLQRRKKNKVFVDVKDLLDIKVYKYPVGFRIQNYPKVRRITLENDAYATLFVSTSSRGIISIQQAKQLEISGSIVAKVVAKTPLINLK